jgi:dynein heavy chain
MDFARSRSVGDLTNGEVQLAKPMAQNYQAKYLLAHRILQSSRVIEFIFRFLTAMKQEVTRMHKGGGKDKEGWSLDDVAYHSIVKEREYESIKDIQSEGVYIHGLSIEGARYAKNGLDDPEPKKLFAPLPILYVTAINKKKNPEGERMAATYSCPVYKYPKRTDRYIIFRVGLPCEGSGP